jgi:hypothetical protein
LARNRLVIRRGCALLCAVVACVFLWGVASGHASSWSRPAQNGLVEARDLSRVEARARIQDGVLKPNRAEASSQQPPRVEQFTDEHGHTITIGTAIPLLDLQPYAAVLAGTIHGDELSELRVLVVPPEEVAAACGGEDTVLACYGADDAEHSYAGEMIIPSADPDLVHLIVHEYGHHMDNALVNLSHLGLCRYDNDGSRRWFFARDAYDDLINRSGCNRNVPYRRLLGETFAEDFVVLNGIDNWFLSAVPPPTGGMLRAMRADIVDPFERQYERRSGWLGGTGRYRLQRFHLDVWTYFSAHLRGPLGRRADFDLYLYRRGGRRPLERSQRPASRERVARWLGPGRYEIVVHSYRGYGGYRVRFDYN